MYDASGIHDARKTESVHVEKDLAAKVWNGAAVKPKDLHIFGAEAWKGEGPEEERGLVVFGVPVGHSAFVQKWLADKEGSHLQLLARIPAVQDAQCAWLLLLMCAGPRANHILRNLPPSEASEFSQHHDNHLRACLADIIAMAVPDGVTTEVVQLPFREGGLGLRSAVRLAPAAYWASWADCFSGACPRTTGLHSASPRVGRAAVTSTVCSGSPRRCRHARSRRHGGARVVQILGP